MRIKKTTNRSITQRSVLYVGFPCNLRCKFCYYAYTKAAKWHPLEETKRDASLFREKFGNDRVDITGGEPTIYPHIHELVRHCNEIGLRPTLITNMQALAQKDQAKEFKESGVFDFLCSVHNLYEDYDAVTQKDGAFQSVEKAIDNLNELGIPWRANCTMVKTNMGLLKDIAEWCHERKARVINFIEFNPFYEWRKMKAIDFQAKHSEIAPHLVKALEYCDSVGLEANVRYFPHCLLPGHEEKSYNFMQLPYDSHEWDFASWYSPITRAPADKLDMQYYIDAFVDKGTEKGRAFAYKTVARKQRHALYTYSDKCVRGQGYL